MEIHCKSISAHSLEKGEQIILCNEARHDLALEQIIHLRGIDFVLGAIGEKAIQIYMEANGYAVVDIEKTVKAA
jgi:hypothetical protein